MQLISHRGNRNGPNPNEENNINYIENTIKAGYNVECDIWVIDNFIYLSHDIPNKNDLGKIISIDWLHSYQEKLLVHCKNKEAIKLMMDKCVVEWFAHDKDRWITTSCGNWICYGEESEIINDNLVIVMMPEHHNIREIPRGIYGICTDFVENYKDKYGKV